MLPAAVYSLDDGTAETAIGSTSTYDIICLNEFATLPGSETITSLSIVWGTPSFPDPTLDGLPYLAVIWSDPNGDGDPHDAIVLGTARGVISSQGSDTFVVTNLSRTIPTANFFVGFLVTQYGQFPAAFDKTAPTYTNRSYIASSSQPGTGNIYDLSVPVIPIEQLGLSGNWLIRAEGTSASPLRLLSTLSESVQGAAGPFDIELPPSGPAAIECRIGRSSTEANQYKWVFTFSEPVVRVDSATVDCGSVQRIEIDPSYPYRVSLYTANARCSGRYVTATLAGVHAGAETLPSASATMGLLVGDVNADGVVDRSDLTLVGAQRRAPVWYTNFRLDVSADGQFATQSQTKSPDQTIVKQHLGESL